MLDEHYFDVDEHKKKLELLPKKGKARPFTEYLKKGDVIKNDQLATKDNPYGAGKPTILARPDVWAVLHKGVLEYGFKPEKISLLFKEELDIDVTPDTIANWRYRNTRGIKDKVELYLKERVLKQMMDKAIENQVETLDISMEDGMRDPRLLAIRQKATEHVLETLGSEIFGKDREKSAEDKTEQMLRMRLMLQKLIEPEKVYDTTATTNTRLSEGDVSYTRGGSSDPDSRTMYDLRAHLQEAVSPSES